ncbi:hypothetical protein V6N13_010728 [Hibiscus sabdariffa]
MLRLLILHISDLHLADAHHQFNAGESDWGFTSFMPLSEVYDLSRGYLVNDTLIVEAEVVVCQIVDYRAYDSKKETGYVGLKNQGATCYMNSLLQTLYHIPYFRKAVYHMPTTENDMPSGSIPLALQSLFYKLQYSDSSVATKELTKSFGWDTHDSFMQHDVQELNRVLCEKLEDKMKGTVVEDTIQKLFAGHHMNYIECINVDYKSTRKESFCDLQLDVKGCRNVYASFDKYVEVERLEGDNKHRSEQYGLQDAKKGVLFIDFPPVLQLQLKRFEYDFLQDTMGKINDRYEFPLHLDLDRDDGKYLSPEADRSVRNLYLLHSVLVHSGGVHGGHYYVYIRPTLSDQWYKFDDERVTKEDMKKALEEQYGGEELPRMKPGFYNTPKLTKNSNAYMLVYIRESDKDRIMCNVDEKDIADHIMVARDDDLAEHIGKDIYFDLVDQDKVRSFHIQKQTIFSVFMEEVAREFGIPVQFQRFWLWAKRQNHTYRPNQPLTILEETQSVGRLREVSNKVNNAEAELMLFLEVELGLDLEPIALPYKTKEDILLFFKHYDPEKEKLRYAGRLLVKSAGKPIEILSKLNEMAGYAPDEGINLYEEIRFEPSVMCEPIDKESTFQDSQLVNGDIICFQKALPDESTKQYRYPDVPSFLEYVHYRQVVHFRSLENPKEDDFCLEMSKLYTYDDVVERVAQKLGLDDPSKIRLTPHNCYSQQPKPPPVKYRGVDHLSDMLFHYSQASDILYYEVLDIPLPELQCLKTLKIAFHHAATKGEVVSHTIRLPKQSTVGDVINDLKTKVELSHPDAELRLLQIFHHKIYKVFQPSDKIENINDKYWTLRAEEIPEEEKNLGPNDCLIHAYHFSSETTQNQTKVHNFGDPFFLLIHEGETLAEIKVRIQRKLQVPDEEFAKWKFAFLSLGRPEFLHDSAILSSRFQRQGIYGDWEQFLGLEHNDNVPKRADAVNQSERVEWEAIVMVVCFLILSMFPTDQKIKLGSTFEACFKVRLMRRQGQYANAGGSAYASAQMQHMPAQRMELKSDQFQGQLEAFTPERDQPYRTPKSDGQWRWERDGSKVSNSMTPKMFNEDQGADGSRTYFQGQRPDPNMSLEKQNTDLRSQPHDENMEVGYEQNLLPPTLEGLEKKFHDDIMKLAENTRQRGQVTYMYALPFLSWQGNLLKKINAINAQYQEQLTAIRARHTDRRDEFLQKESLVREQQYQQAMMDYYSHGSVTPADAMPTGNNLHGYGSVAGSAAVRDGHRGYNSNNFDSYRERSRFLGGARDQGFEPRGSYLGRRAYDTGSRYY